MGNARTVRWVVTMGAMGILAGVAAWWMLRAPAPIEMTIFEDITSTSGIVRTGMTHGAYWGDVDGNGRPDLYLTNHLDEPSLFRNVGGGQFRDVTAQWFTGDDLKGDKHGAAWADFDNDGRADLVQLTGAVRGAGAEPKRLFHNRGEAFVDVAAGSGVLNPEGRTRNPLWVDLDGDGRLDLIHGAEMRFDDKTPPFVFLQGNGLFTDVSDRLAFKSRSVPFCILTELTGDQHADLVCHLMGKDGTVQVLDIAALPARTLDLLPVTAFEDIVAGDFDNDGAIDLFLARKNPPGPVAFGQSTDREFVADLNLEPGAPASVLAFGFRAQGPVRFEVASMQPADGLTPDRIFLGAAGAHPEAMSFELSPEAAAIGDGGEAIQGPEAAFHITRESADRWRVRYVPAAAHVARQIQVKVAASQPISELRADEGLATIEEAPGRLFMNRGGKMIEESDKRGVNVHPVAGMNVVAADFDNDMDLDIFVLASGDIGMQPNLLLLNRGDGYFNVVKNAGGAPGGGPGVGDSVTTADFDGDGFVDLLLATGGSMGRSLGLPADGGGYRLYRNTGNGNHWLGIDLVGTRSNRDGVGAIVRVTAGAITQTRVQDGGIHHRGQNHARLHFGLGDQSNADKLTIYWPSGDIQEVTHVAANQVIRVIESEKLDSSPQ